MSLVSYFPPGMVPRELQVKALGAIEEAIKGPKKHIVLRAPTGSGKSAIAATVSRFFTSQGGSYLLCSRKYLQEQYLRDFSSIMTNFWGKSNYTCPIINRSCSGCPADQSKSSADYAMYLRTRCTSKKIGDKCPYIAAKDKALESSVSLLNFEAFIANNLYGKEWPQRKVIIVDEAHNFCDRLAEQLSIPLPKARIPNKVPQPAHSFTFPILSKLKEFYEEEVRRRDMLGQSSSKEKLYVSLLEKYPHDDSWVAEKDSLKLYRARDSIKEYLSRMAEKVIWMSASITNSQCLELGLTAVNSVIVDLPSEFDLEDHPIRCPRLLPIPKTYSPRGIASDPLKGFMGIKKLLKTEVFPNHKRGIIHTHSYALAKALKSGCTFPKSLNILFHTDPKKTNEAVEAFTSRRADWIVTPTLSEGFDGAGDLVQAQVILKTPWPSLSSAKMKRMLNSTDFGKKLYRARALSAFIQSYGRGSRYKGDKCVTYIVDVGFSRLLSGGWEDIPMWFRKVLRYNGFWDQG
tara:strand:+ start:2666 stop:4216 length:1551 start_codon:yes stop_codon:yes gene_type:complete